MSRGCHIVRADLAGDEMHGGDVLRDPFVGIGKPEPLKHILTGAWSRRIDEVNRLVYYLTDHHIVVLHARDHY